MPTTEPRRTPGETREMRLFSKVINQRNALDAAQSGLRSPDASLAEFIARRRQPGTGWHSWDELRYALRDATGEIASDATIRKWARVYGIPEHTQPDGEGRTSAKEYAAALKRAGILL